MSETKVEQPVQAAARLNREGKFGEALALVAPIVEKGEKQPIAFLQMSRALRGMKDDKAAREVEQSALELFPDNLRVVAHVGNFLVSTDREFAKAVDLVGPHLLAGRIDPDLVVIASIALRALKRESEADATELKGLAAHPDNAQLLTRRATVLNRGGRFADVVTMLAGKDAAVENSPGLKTQLQRAQEGLAAGAAPVNTPASKAEAAPSVPAPAASPVATKQATATVPVTAPAPAARATTPATPVPPAAGASKTTTQSVPATALARPASAQTPSSSPVQSASSSRSPTTHSAALASTPTLPTPTPQSARPLPAASAPPPPVSRAPDAQQTIAKSTPAPTPSSPSASQATAARQMAAAPGPATAGSRPQSPVPAQPMHRADTHEANEPRSGISAFGVIFWGLVIVAAGLLIAYYAGVIDLTQFFQQVSAMIEAARGN